MQETYPMLWFGEIVKLIFGSFRMAGLLVAMPVIGASSMPVLVKVVLSIGLSASVVAFQPAMTQNLFEHNGIVILVAMRELGIGLFIGFMARFLFLAITMSLEFSGMQMGFGMASFFDPQSNSQTTVLSQVGLVMGILFMFITNIHHEIFMSLIKSFEVIPIGLPSWEFASMGKNLLYFVVTTFEIAIRLSMPVLAVMIIIHFVMGVISKTAPQMNLFFNVSFIVNFAAGLTLVALSLPSLMTALRQMADSLTQRGYGII